MSKATPIKVYLEDLETMCNIIKSYDGKSFNGIGKGYRDRLYNKLCNFLSVIKKDYHNFDIILLTKKELDFIYLQSLNSGRRDWISFAQDIIQD